MLHLVRNNSPYTVIILLIFALVVKMQALFHPAAPIVPDDHLLYGGIVWLFNKLLNGNAFGYTMLAVVMVVAQALYINSVALRYKMYSQPTYVVAYLYLLLSSLYPGFNYFSEPLLINWVLIVGIDILLGFHHTLHPRKHIFNAGFVLSIAALFQYPALGFVLLLFVALIMQRSFNIGEWIVAIMGYLTPIYFFIALLFLMDKLPAWSLPPLGYKMHIKTGLYMTGLLSGCIILLLCGFIVLQRQMNKISVFTRRNWVMILGCIFISLMVSLFIAGTNYASWMLVIPALSLVIAHAFYLENNKVFSNFVFYFSLALLLFCQITY